MEQLLRDAGLSSADWHDLLLAAAVPRHVVMLVEVRQRAWVMDLLPYFELVSFQVDASKLEVLSAPCPTVLVPRTARVYPTPTGRDGRSLSGPSPLSPDDTDGFNPVVDELPWGAKKKHFSVLSSESIQRKLSRQRNGTGVVSPFALRTVPYVVRVVFPTATGTGTVMQYRCGAPPLFVSDDWWLVTNSHAVWLEGTTTLVAEAFVEFCFEVGRVPYRVDIDMSSTRLLSPPAPPSALPSLAALDVAIVRWVPAKAPAQGLLLPF